MLRCIAVLFVVTIPLLVTWVYVDDVLLYLGVSSDICSVVEAFLKVRMFGVPFDILCISYDKYLVSIGVVEPAMYASFAFNVILVLLNYFFIDVCEMDFPFIAWSYVISACFHIIAEFSLSLSYIEVIRTLTYPKLEIFKDWDIFFGLGLPGCVMICAEWWAYEILTVFASMLGADAVDSQTIILQISVLVFMLPYGLGVASASIVGNALGAGELVLAKRSGSLALFLIFLVDILIAVFLITAGPYYIAILTTNSDVTETTNRLLPFLALFMLMDGIQGVSSGILRGAGKQTFGAILGFFTYYTLGLPMAWFLTFKCKLGVSGLLCGISTGAFVQTVVLLLYIFCFSSHLYSMPVVSSEVEIKLAAL